MKNMEADIELIRESGMFDEQWYLKEYPEVGALGLDPYAHYMHIGARLGRHPGPGFDAAWYLENYRDVADLQINPLLHYLTHGRFEGREIRRIDHGRSDAAHPHESDRDCLTILPGAGGKLPDLFRLKALQPQSKTLFVTYCTSLNEVAQVDRLLQEQDESFDHIAVCPTSLMVKNPLSVAARCRQKSILIYPDRYGSAASFAHLMEAGILTRYEAVCWICNGVSAPADAKGLATLLRGHADIGLISQSKAPYAGGSDPEIKHMLETFLTRLSRKMPENVYTPVGAVTWINPLLLHQLRAIPVRPHELLDKQGKAHEAGASALRALMGISAQEGGMEQLDFAAAIERGKVPKGSAAKKRKVKAIAFYLPQFHPIPENDLWWGKGFTEWNNVVRAKPMFRGHSQPRIPTDLGYYDLRLPQTQEAQAQLAQNHGVHGFCYYYYWFNGKKLLNQPIEQMMKLGRPNMPFCVCWANENWSRNWDGQNRHVLLEQQYSMDSNRLFIREMIPMMKDPRYIRHHGKPLLMVYRIRIIPNWRETAEMWREECRRAGIGEIHLCAVRFGLEPLNGPPEQFGVDSYVLFPPHETARLDVRAEQIDLQHDFGGELFSYDAVVDGDVSRFSEGYPWPVHRGAMMAWDNTARRLGDARVFVGSTPARFRYWLRKIVEQENRFNNDDESLVFINAWNEWAEGTYLEPDQRFGTGYLSAVKSAFADCDTGPITVSPPAQPPVLLLPKPEAPAVAQPLNTRRIQQILPNWYSGERPLLEAAPAVLLCAHISGHQLFGGERSFLDVLKALTRLNLNVFVTLPSGNNKDYVESVRQLSVGVYVFSYPQWMQDREADEALVLTFADIIARHDIALVHANTIVLLEPLIAARRMNRIPLIHSRELITLDESLRDRMGLSAQEIIRKVFELSDYLVANSRATADAFPRQGRTFHATNVVDPASFDAPNIVDGPIRFAIVSSNIPKKGVADFIEVAKHCEGKVDNAEFLVIGPENKQIEQWRGEQKRGAIPANVKFLGYRDTPEEAMVEANVILNLSNFAESFGRTAAEAMAARRPVIAYEWGALPELVRHGVTGFLAPYRDTGAVAAYVAELCENPGRIAKMGAAGRAFVEDNCTPEKLYEHLRTAYSAILGDEIVQRVPVPAASAARRRSLTIVVPVYNAHAEVRACLESVVRNTDLASHRVIVINDGSTDPAIAELLAGYQGTHGISIHSNEQNIGYTKTVNIGLHEAGDDDVVLLNSDTIVTPQWVEGLRTTAYAETNIGTVTAMSDNAGAFSFPVQGKPNPKPAHVGHDEYAAVIVQAVAACQPIEVPTGSGFCMYIRRELIERIGAFDEEAFPRGYGEENDFCMRAGQAGWRNLITPRSFVFHVRSASFGAEKVQLVQQGVDVVTRRYPEYSKLTRAAFSSAQMKALQQAVTEAAASMAELE